MALICGPASTRGWQQRSRQERSARRTSTRMRIRSHMMRGVGDRWVQPLLASFFQKGKTQANPSLGSFLALPASSLGSVREKRRKKEEPRAVPSIWLQNPAKWQLAACTSAPPPPRSPAFSTWPHAANDFCQASSMRCFWIAATFDHLASSLMSTGALHCRPCKPHKMRFGVWDADRIYAACQTVHLKRITDG